MGNWMPIWDNRNLLLSGMWFTVSLAISCVVVSTLVGFLIGLGRRSGRRWVTSLFRAYVELFRGSPPLIQLLFVFYGAAYLRIIGLPTFGAALIALSLFSAAHISEVFRAGFEAVPVGQREASKTLGLNRTDALRFVVFPQAMRVALPPLFGQYLTLVKNTSLASIIGYADIMRQAQGIISRYHNPFQVLLVVALFYFLVCYPLARLARRLERRTVA